jgi:hypothetical protein
MGLEYIVQPQVFLGGLTALGPGIQGLTEQYPLLTTYYSWTSTASVNLSSFPIPIDAGSIYGGPGKESSFIVSVGGVVQSPTQYTVDSILRTITFNTTGTVISAGIEFAVTQLATAAPSSQNLNYIKSVSAEFTTLTSTDGSFNNLIVTNLTALSTTVNVIDIRVTEISGFRATGDVDVIGDVTMTGSLSVGDILFRTKSQAFPNVFIGDSTTGRDITTGNHNFVFGLSAGSALSYASNNVFIGKCAGRVNITGQHNNFLGLQAGYNNTDGGSNNFFGCNAGLCNTGGSSNNFLGNSAGRSNTTGSTNNFLGGGAGFCSTTGYSNNFLGYQTGLCNTTGSSNTFIGHQAGRYNTTGFNNNFLGRCAGCVNTIGSYNTIIGNNANVATNALSGVIVLGTGAVATESHQIVLSTANVLFRSTGNTFEIGSPSLTDNLTVFGNISAANLSKYFVLSADTGSKSVSDGDVAFFETNGVVSLEANKNYKLNYDLYFFNSHGGNLCYILSASNTLNNTNSNFITTNAAGISGGSLGAPIGGVPLMGSTFTVNSVLVRLPNFQTSATTFQNSLIQAIVQTGNACTLNLIISCSSTVNTITPKRGSSRVVQLME